MSVCVKGNLYSRLYFEHTLNLNKNRLKIIHIVYIFYLNMVSSEIKQLLKREIKKDLISSCYKRKITAESFFIPTIHEANEFSKYNYNVAQLKQIARHYKLPVSGNKSQIITIIYNFLSYSNFCTIIQKHVRGFFVRKVLRMRGPALYKRGLCNNQEDFLTFTSVKEIPTSQFFSFKCSKGFIYGFDIISLYQLFMNNTKNKQKTTKTINPYTREEIDNEIFYNIEKVVRLSKLFFENPTLISYENEIISSNSLDTNNGTTTNTSINHNAVSAPFDYAQHILNICYILDNFGNYTDVEWFTLSRDKIISFIRQLYDIWFYRAQLSQETRISICPPLGNPFLNLQHYSINSMTYQELQKIYIRIIENIITKAHDYDNRSLGGMYVLTALTLVSPNAAAAMPWLYESVMN